MLKGLRKNRLRQYFDSRYQDWLARRLPPARQIDLDRNRLFVFPSRAGGFFLVVLLLLWLAATNYENNLIFAFTFLLTALFVVGIMHTFANLAGVTVTGVRALPAFAGELAEFDIALSQQRVRRRQAISLHFRGAVPLTAALADIETLTFRLAVPASRRGWLEPGRLTLESLYPLGLFRVWTHLDVDLRALIYPRPVRGFPAVVASASHGEGLLAVDGGSEDFRGLEKYRAGESLRHVAWKQYAREQGLYTKRYADPLDERIWLDWEAFPGMHREARLSRLCGWLLDVSATHHLYGLRLPGMEIPPGRGDGHRDEFLRVLALYELAAEKPGPGRQPRFGAP